MGPGLLFTACTAANAIWKPLHQRLVCWAGDRNHELVSMWGGAPESVPACCDEVTVRCPSVWVSEALLDAIADPLILEAGGTDYHSVAVAGTLVTVALGVADVSGIDPNLCSTQARVVLTATFPAGQHQLHAQAQAPIDQQPVTWTVRETAPGSAVLGMVTSPGPAVALGAPRVVPAVYTITFTSDKAGAVARAFDVTVDAAGVMSTVPVTPAWMSLP